MSYLKELLSQVMASLLRNKLRTCLTMAGIAWGIASVVIIAAMGDSFKEGQRNSMKTLGENIVILFGGRTELQAGGQRAGRRIRLNYSDVENLRRECYLVDRVAGELEGDVRATSPWNSGSFDVSGVEYFFNQLRSIPLAEGRFISPQDEKDAERVVIIGVDVKKQLFGARSDVLGTTIAINSMPFRIIGIMASKDQNSSYSGLDEKKIWMPYPTMARDVPPKKYYVPGYLDEILYSLKSPDQFEETRAQVIHVLARTHDFLPADKSAMNVWDTVENQKMVDGILDSMTLFLSIVGFITMSLGGIGVMNIMLVTVSERTREIGLRKALGATKVRIMTDFLAEGMLMAFTSGLIGWLVAFGLSSALKLVQMPDVFPGLPVSASTTVEAFIALTIISVLSSLFPAWRAASLTPVEALRYER
jgi:putative ABC transport system permease protein